MKNSLLLLLTIAIFFTSCNDDFGTKSITYTKATATYGDLDEIRNAPLVQSAQSIVDPGKVYITEEILLIGEEGSGIHVYDNSNPENPQKKIFINIPSNREFYVQGDFLFAESMYDMLKIDISNPFQPSLVTRVENAFASPVYNDFNLAVIGFDYKEVTEEAEINSPLFQEQWNDNGVFYFDFRESLIPPSAVPSSFAGNNNGGIGSVNRIAYSKNNIYAISRSNLLVFNDLGTFSLTQNMQFAGTEMETIYPLGDKLFIGSRNSMTIYDISDADNPAYESNFWHENSCDPVFPESESTAYLTLRTGDFAECPGDQNELTVLDISDSWSIRPIQTIAMESPYGMTMIGDRLYVGEGKRGLKIFDATNRRNLVLEHFDRSVEAYDVIAHPTKPNLLLIAGPNGFSQYNKQGNKLELLSNISL